MLDEMLISLSTGGPGGTNRDETEPDGTTGSAGEEEEAGGDVARSGDSGATHDCLVGV